ncbi:fatty acid desaturase family protein [Pseudomonas chlororaphis]|uniref:Fatty acid desaturase n=1 Tax=Pseudomonas chlororaphis TaxID=587753 RepID=A0AAX3FTZ1_9PSED|nr:fatty acid desaturase [Pseudomonas chlororaphis]AZC39762.1 Fatty acid desaturase [Pseudomonas chlororaphis subsp. piscium]AZC46314.1 Fatty acid desaturase [Pseudomonas chlororaphis subsp. piscium]WDG71830.1 fatty acid desaturase [Pseudomonas chlororaphis]WDH30387.1 fatty acid desaturase [Pseudomonas chlororaphis]WDH70355.1 fatty acid desaturase [Pseudomonas chlororaphis]
MRTLDTSTAPPYCPAGSGQEQPLPGAIPWPTDGLNREQLARYGKELIRQTLPFTVENRRLSWWHFYSTLLVIGLFGAAVAMPLWWPLRLTCSVLLGLSLVRMFVLYHDYMHGAILKGSRFAEVFFKTFGLLLMAPPTLWKQSHDYHHGHSCQYVGAEQNRLPLLSTHTDLGTFPLLSTEEYVRAGRLKRLRYHIARHPLMILLASFSIFIFSICMVSLITQPRHRLWSLLALALNLASAVTLALLAPDILLYGVLIPSLSGSALGAYMFYCQHNFPGVRYPERADWDYAATAVFSSSYMRTGPLMAWFTANIGYHHVHHANSGIPFYRLPEAMAAIPALQSPITTSLHPRDIYHCLRLKLWDPARQRMISFAEFRQQAQH